MSAINIDLDISEEQLKTLDEIAANMAVDRATVLREAIAFYLADYAQEGADLAESIRQADAGETISHEDMLERFAKVKQPASRAKAA
jgi:predicted transcriptional regulator